MENKADPSGYKMQCHLCDQIRVKIDELRAHWNEAHPGQTDKSCIPNINMSSGDGHGTCDICGQRFDNLRGFRLHYTVMHTDRSNSQDGSSTCEYCGEQFDSVQDIRAHLAKVHQENIGSENDCKIYKCRVCGEIFNSVYTLSKHKQLVHEIEPSPSFRKSRVCDICGKDGMTSVGLKYHMRTHDANRPKKCTYCDKEFESYSNMTRHRKIAHAEQWKIDKEKLFDEEGGRRSKSQRERNHNYQKMWYEKNRVRVRELERARARAKRTGEKFGPGMGW